MYRRGLKFRGLVGFMVVFCFIGLRSRWCRVEVFFLCFGGYSVFGVVRIYDLSSLVLECLCILLVYLRD